MHHIPHPADLPPKYFLALPLPPEHSVQTSNLGLSYPTSQDHRPDLVQSVPSSGSSPCHTLHLRIKSRVPRLWDSRGCGHLLPFSSSCTLSLDFCDGVPQKDDMKCLLSRLLCIPLFLANSCSPFWAQLRPISSTKLPLPIVRDVHASTAFW